MRSDFDWKQSDVDLVVEFESLPAEEYAHHYFAFHEALTQLLARKMDLVVALSIRNPYLSREVEASQELLYAA